MPIKITNTGSVVYNPRYVGPKQYTDQSTGRILNTVDSGVVAPYERTGIGTGGTEAPNPVSIVTRLKDSSTDGKTLPATKGSNATLKSINTLTFDGSNDHVDLVDLPQELFKTGVFEIELDILIDDSDTGYHRILQFYANDSAFWRLQKNTGANTYQIWCRNSSGNQIYRDNAISFTADTLFHIKIVGDGTDVKVFHDDSLVDTLTITTANLESGTITYAEPSLGDASTSFKGQMSNFKVSAGPSNTLHTHLPLQEGVGVTTHDISGNGNHATIDGCTHTTLNGLTSNNHKNGFNDDIFLGYKGFWDATASGSGTFTISEDNITLAGNTGTSGKIRQHVYGLVSGDTLVITGTVTQTGGGADNVAISSASAGFAESSVFISDGVGTNTFTKTFNANSSTCDIQLVAISGANFVISDLKFTVVKKIPALTNKTLQVAKLDGTASEINTGYHPSDGDLVIEASVKFDSVTDERNLHSCNGNLGYFFRANDGEWQLYVDNGYIFTAFIDQSPTVGPIFDTRLEYTASTNTWVAKSRQRGLANNEFQTLGTGSRTPNFGSANLILGQKSSTQYFDGEYHSFKLTDAGVVKVDYDLHRDDDAGKSTVTDRSGNDNDGTVTTGSGGLNAFWGVRTNPTLSGFQYVNAPGTIVNANYRTGSTSVTNPANSNAIHNNSECSISFNSKSLAASSLSDFKNNVEPSLSGVWLNKTSDELVTELVEYGNYTIASSAATSAVNTKYFDGREI